MLCLKCLCFSILCLHSFSHSFIEQDNKNKRHNKSKNIVMTSFKVDKINPIIECKT